MLTQIIYLLLGVSACPTDTAYLSGKCMKAGIRTDDFNNATYTDVYAYLKSNYCENIINYPISCEQYDNKATYDALALAQYQALYQSYKTTGTPNSDCLGIARVVFCAYQFKYCDPDTGNTDFPICGFLCQTWLNRCPDQSNLYDLICKNPDGSGQCSYGTVLRIGIVILLLLY